MKETRLTKQKEDSLLGDLYYDLKGKKRKLLDWIAIAERCEKAVKMYGSAEEAAEKLSVSSSLLNSILRLKKLDPRVQEMVRRRELLFDSAQRLNVIKPNDRQFEIAKILVKVSNKKQREIIQHAKNFPDSDLVDYRNRVAGEKVRRERIRVLILPMREEMYQLLGRASRKEGKPVEKIILELINDWLKRRSANK